jgi:hypothetical protein
MLLFKQQKIANQLVCLKYIVYNVFKHIKIEKYCIKFYVKSGSITNFFLNHLCIYFQLNFFRKLVLI